MSIYTTKFQNVIKAYGKPQQNLIERIDLMRADFFNFDYATPQSVDAGEFKTYFERLLITHYFTDEFAFETIEEFKLYLMSKTLEIMPSYAQRLNILYTTTRDSFYNETITHNDSRNVHGERKTTNVNGERKTTNANGQRVSTTDNTDVSSDLPINLITTDDIEHINFASEGRKTHSNNTQNAVTDTSTQDAVTDTSTQDAVTDTSTQDGVTKNGNIFSSMATFNKDIAPVITELLEEYATLFMWIW